MSQAATICRSNFKVSLEAERVLPEVRGRGRSSGRSRGAASTWGRDDGSAPCGPGASMAWLLSREAARSQRPSR